MKNNKLHSFMENKINLFCDKRIKENKKISMVSKFIIALLIEGDEITIDFLEGLFGNFVVKYSIEELNNLCLINLKNNTITLQGRYNSANEKYKLFKKAYTKLLKDKKWKNYPKDSKCALCGKTENLQLHHTFYVKDAFCKPWEYPKESIVTLCGKCHMNVHFDKHHPMHEQTITREEVKKIYKYFI